MLSGRAPATLAALAVEAARPCEDRIGTGPPRVKTLVIYVDLGCWAFYPYGPHCTEKTESATGASRRRVTSGTRPPLCFVYT